MSKDIKKKLLDLGLDESKADDFLEEVEVRNRSIEDQDLIRRESEELEETEETEVEETNEDVEIVIDEDAMTAIFEAIKPQVEEMMTAQRSADKEEIEALKTRIAELEKDDDSKVKEAVEDLPEARKSRKVVYRPSQNKVVNRSEDNQQEVDAKAQLEKMKQIRAERRGENQFA